MREAIHVTRAALKPMAPPRPTFSARPGAQAPDAARPAFAAGGLLPAAILARTRDVIAAHFNDLLDRGEEPAKMIRLMVIEMEEALVDARAASVRALADRKDLLLRIARLERRQGGWLEKAELALAKGREDLARAALVEKHHAAASAESLAAEVEAIDERLRAAEADVGRVEAKLREARGRHRAIRARVDSAERQARLRTMHSGPQVDDAFSRFAVLDRRVDEAEARAEALMLGAPPATLEEEIAALAAADKVDAALAGLKARRAAKGE
jgi:phage shock protein A